MIEIKCIVDECGNEYLPDITDTQLFINDLIGLTKRQEQMAKLYMAIVERENYWYSNKPTAFGNPDYSLYCGVVNGMIGGLDWDYSEENDWIIIKVGKRTIMKIQKPKRSKAYWDARRDNAEVMSSLGL